MTPSLQKMWISFGAMGFMIISLFSIYFSRYKLKGILKGIVGVFAYLFMILAGIIMFLVVLSGPTQG